MVLDVKLDNDVYIKIKMLKPDFINPNKQNKLTSPNFLIFVLIYRPKNKSAKLEERVLSDVGVVHAFGLSCQYLLCTQPLRHICPISHMKINPFNVFKKLLENRTLHVYPFLTLFSKKD